MQSLNVSRFCLFVSWVIDVSAVGIQLGVEKTRRRENMKNLEKKLQRTWSATHKSQDVLSFLKDNLPPVEVFEEGDNWTDPPKCMPEYYRADESGVERDVVEAYRLYYAGSKVTKKTRQNLFYECFLRCKSPA
jgi:hypothetical protein